MQDDTQQNTGSKWWQQEAFSEQRLQGLSAPERVEKQTSDEEAGYTRAGQDAASLLAEELRRKDAHIAKLEAMLRQAEAGPTEHERRPEAFLPPDVPERMAEPSKTIAASSNGAMVYDAPPVVSEAEADGANSMAAGSVKRVGGAMVYDSPAVALGNARIRLADMNLESSPIAQIVMQAAARRLAEPVPVFEPTLRMPAQAARQSNALRSVENSAAWGRRMAAVGALGLLAFAGVIGASRLRAPRSEPILITPPAIDRPAFAAAPVKVSKPNVASAMRTTDFSNSSIEILPVAPAPPTIKRSTWHTDSAHTVAVAKSSPASSHVHIVQEPVRAVHVVQPRVHVAAPTAHIQKSDAPPIRAETSGVIVEADEERAGTASAFHSDTVQPTDSAEAAVPSHRAEVLPDDTRDTYEDSRASDYRARRRRGYRYSQPEPTETRRSAYKYGEGANRRSGDDAESARRSARGYNERTNERTDTWTDERPDW